MFRPVTPVIIKFLVCVFLYFGAPSSARAVQYVQREPMKGTQTITFKNTCTKSMQFTVLWSGTGSPKRIIYRIGGMSTREVTAADSSAVISSEAPATFGLGPAGDVEIVQRNTTVPDLFDLYLVNKHRVYAFVDLKLKLYYKPPVTGFSTLTLQQVVAPSPKDFRFYHFDKTVFDRCEVESMKAEDDPN